MLAKACIKNCTNGVRVDLYDHLVAFYVAEVLACINCGSDPSTGQNSTTVCNFTNKYNNKMFCVGDFPRHRFYFQVRDVSFEHYKIKSL